MEQVSGGVFMTCRATMYFNLRKGGWTESLYTGGSLSAAYIGIMALADKRIQILVDSGSLDFVGVRDMSTPRRSTFSPLGSLRTGVAGPTKYRDLYNAAVMVRLNTVDSASNPWLHGLPDDWMQGDAAGNFTLTGDGLAGINAYLAFLIGQNMWQCRVQVNSLDAGTPKIQNITYVAGVLHVFASASLAAAGEQVIITGCKGYNARQFNGTFKVISNTAGDLILTTAHPLTTNFTYVGNSGRIRFKDYGFQGLTSADIRKVGTKKMGRPINGPVGRRRA